MLREMNHHGQTPNRAVPCILEIPTFQIEGFLLFIRFLPCHIKKVEVVPHGKQLWVFLEPVKLQLKQVSMGRVYGCLVQLLRLPAKATGELQ